jgi:hypothetical protein
MHNGRRGLAPDFELRQQPIVCPGDRVKDRQLRVVLAILWREILDNAVVDP